jgi:hypothetical protein
VEGRKTTLLKVSANRCFFFNQVALGVGSANIKRTNLTRRSSGMQRESLTIKAHHQLSENVAFKGESQQERQ